MKKLIAGLLCVSMLSAILPAVPVFASIDTLETTLKDTIIPYAAKGSVRHKPLVSFDGEWNTPYEFETISDSSAWESDPSAFYQPADDVVEKTTAATAAVSNEIVPFSNTTFTSFNTITSPTISNGANEPKSAFNGFVSEEVSPYSGELTMRFQDLTLAGRNGLDLNIGRIYQSSAATLGDMRLIMLPNENGILREHTAFDFSNYYLNRYNLGTGWSFSFPSVQIETEYIPEEIGETYFYIEEKEIYYHTGTGAVYQISNSTPSRLKDYYGSDVLFSSNDTGYSNGQVTSQYSFERADKTKEYFAADGRLIGIRDRFNNVITFEHEMHSIVSRVPDGTFEVYDDMWTISTTSGSADAAFSGMGRFDDSSIRFRRYKAGDAYILSQPIQVEPLTNYTLSTSFYNTNGEDVKIEVIPVDVAYQPQALGHTFWAADLPTGQWYDHTVSFGTSSMARYVYLKYTVEEGANNLHIDHIRLDSPKPLLSKITDSIGREISFAYTGELTEDALGAVTLTVTSPDRTKKKTMVYSKGVFALNTKYNDHDDKKYIWFLSHSDTECDENGENGGPMVYEYNGDMDANGKYALLYADVFSKTHSVNDTKYNRPALGEIIQNGRKIVYRFTPVRKHLGDSGYYDALRVTDRWEEYGYALPGAGQMSYTGQQGKTSYTYSGTYSGSSFNNETGYPNYTFDSTTGRNELWSSQKTQHFDDTTTNRLRTTTTFQNAKLKEEKEENLYDSTTNTIAYTYHPSYKDSPVQIQATTVKGPDTTVKYRLFTYNSWGGMESETVWVDEATKNNASLLEGHTATYAYDPTYKIMTQKSWYSEPSDPVFTEVNVVDTLGRITKTVNAANETINYIYANPARPGNVTTMIQADPMRMHKLTGGDRTVSYTYDNYGLYVENETETADGQTRTHMYEYDYIYGNIEFIRYPDGGEEEYLYYENDGRLYRKFFPYVQANGYLFYILEEHTYHRNVVGTGYADSVDRVFQADAVSKYRVRNGVQTLYNRSILFTDPTGNLKQKFVVDFTRRDPATQTAPYVITQYFHDKFDRLVEIRDDVGHQTKYKYDPKSRPLEITDARNSKYKYEYNDAKREALSYFAPVSAPTTQQNHLRVKYDLNGNVIQRSAYPNGPGGAALTEHYRYNTGGNVVWYKDPKEYETSYQYDGLGRLKRTELPTGAAATTSYNAFGTPAFEKIYDGDGAEKSSRVGLVNEAGGMKAKFYKWDKLLTDTNGYATDEKNRTTSAAEGGYSIGYDYDESDNVISEISGSSIIGRRYERFGITISAAQTNDENITTTAFGYDDLGRGNLKWQNDLSVSYAYNTLNLPTTFLNPSIRTESWGYNANGALETISTAGKSFSYEYYDNSMVRYVNYPNNLKTEYIYDNMNRVTNIVTKRGAVTINTLSYSYDANSNMTSETRNGTTFSYTYDELNRLKTASYGDGNTITYHYDALNNRTKETYTNGDVVEYVYNKRYQLVEVKRNGTVTDTYTYNSAGAVLTRNGQSFTYDQWNRLASVDGQAYQYDAEGIRTQANDTKYLTDAQNRVVAEVNGSTVSAEIVYGHQALARKVGSSWYYYIYNAHGDVIGMVNDSGTVVNNYTYDAWGYIRSQTEGVENPIKYAGEYFDSATGLYYFRARYYDPTIGRFTSLDKVQGDISNPLDMNRYVYCRQNPIRYVDPTGESAIAAGAAGSVGIGTGVIGTVNPVGAAVGAFAGGFYLGWEIGEKLDFGTKIAEAQIQARKERIARAIADVISKINNKNPIIIYRTGSGNGTNLTPRAIDENGLSYTTLPPIGQDFTITSMDVINATGVLVATKDPLNATHVLVNPVNAVNMSAWQATRANANKSPHLYTKILQSISIKVRW